MTNISSLSPELIFHILGCLTAEGYAGSARSLTRTNKHFLCYSSGLGYERLVIKPHHKLSALDQMIKTITATDRLLADLKTLSMIELNQSVCGTWEGLSPKTKAINTQALIIHPECQEYPNKMRPARPSSDAVQARESALYTYRFLSRNVKCHTMCMTHKLAGR